jgi:hypothetical protein
MSNQDNDPQTILVKSEVHCLFGKQQFAILYTLQLQRALHVSPLHVL